MASVEKSLRREQKRQKSRYGHKVGSKSVLLMEKLIYDRAMRILSKKKRSKK